MAHRTNPAPRARGTGRERPPLLPSAPDGSAPRRRIVARAGEEPVLRIGLPTNRARDLYHQALVQPWWRFLLAAASFYLAANLVFALLYMADPGGIEHARPGSFADDFFFSIQTMATIGYGVLYPNDLYSNVVVTAETIVALLVLALVTGLLFSRFSRPTARVIFSKAAVIAGYNGTPTLHLRLANARRNQILEARVGLSILLNERTAEGVFMRRFYDLALERSRTPVFTLSFTVMHRITPDSPLHGATTESLIARDAQLLVTVTGLDETMSQTIHARYSYTPDEVLFGRRFADMFGYTEQGRVAIDYRKFDVTVPEVAREAAQDAPREAAA